MNGTELIKRQTATEMAEAYNRACDLIEQGYNTLAEAEKILDTAFGRYTSYGNFDVIDYHGRHFNAEKPEEVIEHIQDKTKRSAWKRILDHLELQKVVTVKRLEEIRKNLESGDVPDIRVETIYDILESFIQNAPNFREELIKEVFEILRPQPRWQKEYKTNDRYQVGKKVILTWYVELTYGGRSFRVNYRRHDELMAIDKVFHLLDGAGIPEGYNGPLIDGIQTSPDGSGETEYFRFKCYLNQNLHLEFKRLDLVKLLNQIAGGGALKAGKNGKGK